MNEEDISIEKCLNVIPNKFELTIYAINRAKELFSGAPSIIENSKFAKKHINKALLEIQENEIDIDELRNRIKDNIVNDDNFAKDLKQDDDIDDKKDSIVDEDLVDLNDSSDNINVDSDEIDEEDLSNVADIDV